MEYSNILSDLQAVCHRIGQWEKQGYAPTIEKDAVLETLRKIYDGLDTGEHTAPEITPTEEITPVDETSRFDKLIEVLQASQQKFIEETRAQISSINEVLARIEMKPVEIPVEKPVEKPIEKPIEKPVTNIKVDVNPVLGFHTLPEGLKNSVLHNLYEGNLTKAEIDVNKMCSLATSNDLLIYVAEHHPNWNAADPTASELISTISK